MKRALAAVLVFIAAVPLAAQYAEKPVLKVGAQIFADYAFTETPESTDADGNRVHANAFNVSRAYVNVTGAVNFGVPGMYPTRAISFRITPDIARESGTGSSLTGSETFRLKYAYAQYSKLVVGDSGPAPLELARTWARIGMQPTPFMEFIEPVYRYRFQGQLFEDREGYESTADTGIGARTILHGVFELQGGIFNGEGFSKAEANNEKSIQFRASFIPDGKAGGLRVTAYVHDDHYLENDPRQRLIASVSYTRPRITAGVDLLETKDRPRASARQVDGRGFTAWVTPKLGGGWEALLRHDEMRPDTNVSDKRKRDIEGIAYWPKVPKGAAAALMLDRDSTRGIGPTVTNWGLKLMVSF